VISPASLCRLDTAVLAPLLGRGSVAPVIRSAAASIVVGAGMYGYVFGCWRSPLQGLYGAVKLPLLFFAVVAASGPLNAWLARAIGVDLSLRQVAAAMLVGLSITALVLGSLSPVVWLFVQVAPAPDPGVLGLAVDEPRAGPSMAVFRALLLMHVAVIAVAGTLGLLGLRALLRYAVADARRARAVLSIWLATTAFVGCELAWLLSPYLCKPTFPTHFVAQTYAEGNFYEQIWDAASGG
jgi:hypothetical protein